MGVFMLLFRTLIVLLVVLLGSASLDAQLTFNQIILDEDPIPSVFDGASIRFFEDAPSINSSGDVAFAAQLVVPDGMGGATFEGAIFGPTSGAGSPLGLIARSGDSAPGAADGAAFAFFDAPSINDSGDVAFQASLRTGTGAEVNFDNFQGIFGPTSGAGSPLGLIARRGSPAPDVNDGAVFGSVFSPSLNESGDVAFLTFLRTGTGPPVNGDFSGGTSNNSAIFGPTAGAGSPFGLVVRAGDPAPGVDGEDFDFVDTPSLNDSGDVAFKAFLRTGTVIDGNNNDAIFGPTAGAGSPLGLVAREDSPAPGFDNGVEFGTVLSPSINEFGDLVFQAFLRSPGDPPQFPFPVFIPPPVEPGPIDSSNNTSLFGPTSGAGSPLGIIFQEDEPAPGVTDGAEFSDLLFSNGDTLGTPALNASGDVAFTTFLRVDSSSIASGTNFALFASIADESQLIVRGGDLVTVTLPDGSGTEDRTVRSIFFSPNGLNDAGELAFRLSFTDGTQGIFTTASATSIPEPSSLALLGLVSLGVMVHRRK